MGTRVLKSASKFDINSNLSFETVNLFELLHMFWFKFFLD